MRCLLHGHQLEKLHFLNTTWQGHPDFKGAPLITSDGCPQLPLKFLTPMVWLIGWSETWVPIRMVLAHNYQGRPSLNFRGPELWDALIVLQHPKTTTKWKGPEQAREEATAPPRTISHLNPWSRHLAGNGSLQTHFWHPKPFFSKQFSGNIYNTTDW